MWAQRELGWLFGRTGYGRTLGPPFVLFRRGRHFRSSLKILTCLDWESKRYVRYIFGPWSLGSANTRSRPRKVWKRWRDHLWCGRPRLLFLTYFAKLHPSCPECGESLGIVEDDEVAESVDRAKDYDPIA